MVRPLSGWARGALWAGGLLWVVVLLVAVVSARLHDQRVALGLEAWLGPLVVGMVAGACAVGLHGVVVAIAHRAAAVSATALVLPLLAMAALAPAAWTAPSPVGPDTARVGWARDVVLVTLDTFRADHLGERAPTPRLEALAARGALFTEAVTPSPLTAPAHASLFTGDLPREHGVVENGRRLDRDTVMAEVAPRMRTGAFVSALVLDRRAGLDRGFTHYDDRFTWAQRLSAFPMVGALWGPGPIRRRGDQTVARAVQWLDASPVPSFCWIHLYDPHAPYAPPRPYRPAVPADPTDPVAQRLLYQGAIAWTDALVGLIVDGVPDDAGVIVVGDHGESLVEHGYWFNHGATLYEPSVRVPLVVRWKGRIPPGTVVEGLTSITDVAGVIRNGVVDDDPLAGLRDRVVVPMYTTGQQQRGPKRSPAAGLRLRDAKLVAQGDDLAYYDLAEDPAELSPLPVPEVLEPDAATIREWLTDEPAPLTAAEREWLRVLGYLD